MHGLIGKKVGMTRFFDDQGASMTATVIQAVPSTVVQIKTTEKDGYSAVQVGYEEQNKKRVNKPLLGHFNKVKVPNFRILREFRDFEGEFKPGDQIGLDIFTEGERVHITGFSKGKGFAGVIKRHGFSGGPKSHGQSDRHRAPGSIGQSAYPKRVFRGLRMGGQTGNKKATLRNLKILKILPEQNLILVQGSVPGARNSILEIYR